MTQNERDLMNRCFQDVEGKIPVTESGQPVGLIKESEMGEVIYLYRRKGLDYWCTCDADRYMRFQERPLFEVKIARNDIDYADLEHEIDALRAENLGMVAQRMAYASEFPLGKDGLPDTGSIHQNIRKLKAEKDELVAALKRIDGMFIRGMVSDSWTTGAIAGEIAHEALAKHRGEAAESPANLTAS